MTRRNFLLVSIQSGLIQPFLTGMLLSKQNSEAATKPLSSSLDLSRLLACIAEVETGNNDDLVGPNEERSKYQITRSVWYQHMSKTDHYFYHCRGILARTCAIRHILWLLDNLSGYKSVFCIALAWKSGLSAFKDGLESAADCDYAQRVSNLYFDSTFHG